jgi:hypothetical protein
LKNSLGGAINLAMQTYRNREEKEEAFKKAYFEKR